MGSGTSIGTRRTSSRSTDRRSPSRIGKLIYQTKPQSLLRLHPEEHGWERFGEDHCGCLPDGTHIDPYVEGAWMTKVGGRYYLQYGAPGTEYNAYANGTYVAASRSARSPTPPIIQLPTSPAASSRAPATDRPSRTATAIGGTPVRRGSATIGSSSGASTCCP